MAEHGNWAGNALGSLAVGPGYVRLVTAAPRKGNGVSADESYETGYREGESSREADIFIWFDDDNTTMDSLLDFFRRITGHPDLEWPEDRVDWRGMFAKYAENVKAQEGYYLLRESDWTPEEWAAITALPGMERPV